MNNNDTKQPEHPLENAFDIEPGSTLFPVDEHRKSKLVAIEDFDDKDKEIEGQFQEVYDAAMQAFDTQISDSSMIDPKYRARNQEVAVQFLNAALTAAKEKATMKQHKDKIGVSREKASQPKTLNQNLIVADRNEILKCITGNDNETD